MKMSFLLSLPWCCIATVASIGLAFMGTPVSFAVDGVAHWFLGASLFFHIAMLRWLKRHHSTCWKKKLLWGGMALTVIMIAFHLTPWHDALLRHAH